MIKGTQLKWLAIACLTVAGGAGPKARAASSTAVAAAAEAGRSLIDAAYNDDTAAVSAMLARRVDVNTMAEDGSTALAWAAVRSNTRIASLLLAAGANPNLVNERGIGPLALAIENGSASMVELLLSKQSNPNLARESGETPLMTAARMGRFDLMKLLLDHAADVNGRDKKFGQTTLMWAAGHPDEVRLLLDRGADLTPVSTVWDMKATIYTPGFHTLGVTGVPWEFQGDYTSKKGGQNALHFAVQARDFESVQMLVAAGMDVNAASADGTTPLLIALYKWEVQEGRPVARRGGGIRGGDLQFVPDLRSANFLLDHGAKVNATDGAGFTPLHGAVLTAAGAGRTGNGARSSLGGPGLVGGALPPAPTADKIGAMAMVKRLLDGGADVNAQTVYPTSGPVGAVRISPASPGSSPLHVAVASKDVQLVQLLAGHRGNPNFIRKDGHTPFSIAVDGNDLAVTKELVARGADLTLRYNPTERVPDRKEAIAVPRQQQTIMHIAAVALAYDVIPYLHEVGAALGEKNSMGETPLVQADNMEVFNVVLALEGTGQGGRVIPRDPRTTDLLKKLYKAVGLPDETKPMETYTPTVH